MNPFTLMEEGKPFLPMRECQKDFKTIVRDVLKIKSALVQPLGKLVVSDSSNRNKLSGDWRLGKEK